MNAHSDADAIYEDANYAYTLGRFSDAFAIFCDLAQTGHVGAVVALAHMHIRGEGTEQDLAKGLQLLERAAMLGHSAAAFNLGALHRSGDFGVPKDPEKSRNFFLLAKTLGCTISVEPYL